MAAYVYMLASRKHGTLYLGSHAIRSVVATSTAPIVDSFTSRYGINKLVWFEVDDDIATVFAREKELKKWRRDWKIRLIGEQNPQWSGLYPGISN